MKRGYPLPDLSNVWKGVTAALYHITAAFCSCSKQQQQQNNRDCNNNNCAITSY